MTSFSLITPCYNLSKVKNLSLNKLNEIDYDNFEVVFVNDASSDNTSEILDSLVKTLKCKYKIINNEVNKGAGETRNVAMLNAKGDYLVFLDSDDYLSSNVFTELDKIINNKKYDCILFDYETVKDGISIKRYNNFDISKDLDKIDAIKYAVNGVCGKCIKKELIDSNKMSFPPFTRNEDYPFFKTLFYLSKDIYYTKNIIYYYNMEETSLMHNKALANVNYAINAFEYLKDRIDDTELLKYLFMRNCYYSNILSMLDLNEKNSNINRHLKSLRKKYSLYYSPRIIKIKNYKEFIIISLSRLKMYWLLKLIYKVRR